MAYFKKKRADVLGRRSASPQRRQQSHREGPMYYILIRGPSYRHLAFEDREKVRENLRLKLEGRGIRFLEYPWIWDEEDRCLLLVGRYENMGDARWWIRALESMGFEISIRTGLPGDESQ
jgi:hypothetical protein